MDVFPTALDAALDDGASAIIAARRVRQHSEIARGKYLELERELREFLVAHPFDKVWLISGASDLVNADEDRPRELWVHRPTADRWVVVTDWAGSPISAVGPFPAAHWDPVLRDHVMLDGHHSLEWIREHIEEFVRDDGRQA